MPFRKTFTPWVRCVGLVRVHVGLPSVPPLPRKPAPHIVRLTVFELDDYALGFLVSAEGIGVRKHRGVGSAAVCVVRVCGHRMIAVAPLPSRLRTCARTRIPSLFGDDLICSMP